MNMNRRGVGVAVILWWSIYNYLCNQCLSPLMLRSGLWKA